MGNLDLERVILVSPQDREELESLSDVIHNLASLSPNYQPEFVEDFNEHPDHLTIIYYNGEAVGLVEIRDRDTDRGLGRETLSFGGCGLPEYTRSGLTQLVGHSIIKKAFIARGKKKMLAETDKWNKLAIMALVGLGFKFIGFTPDGKMRYRLLASEVLDKACRD